MPQLLSPCAATTEAGMPRALAVRREKPSQAQACALPRESSSREAMKTRHSQQTNNIFKKKQGDTVYRVDFPRGSDGKVSAYSAGDLGSIPGSGRSSGEGNGNPVLNSCLENPMDGGAWYTTVRGVPKSQTRTSLSLSVCQRSLVLGSR